MDLKLVGLGLDSVPFHNGWELVEWVPKLFELGEIMVKFWKSVMKLRRKKH